jgi:hypothetical protein
MRPITPAYDPRIFTRTQYSIWLDEDRERLRGWWGRFRRWRLSRREYLSYEEAAELFSIDTEDVETMVEGGYIRHFLDVTRRQRVLRVRRQDVAGILFSEEPIGPPPLWDHDRQMMIPVFPPLVICKM